MTEDKKKTWEDEGLNSEGQDKDKKTSYTVEEVEKMKADMISAWNKWFSKIESEKKVLEKTIDEIAKIVEDKERLIELNDDDPAVAKIILDKYYDWQTIEEYKTSIDYKVDVSDPKVIERMVQKQAKEIAETKLISEKKADFIKRLKMTDEEVEEFEEAFKERTELKTFSVNNLEKHFEKAYRDVNDNTEALKEMKKQEAIANTMATWDNKGWVKATTQKETNQKKNSDYNKNFLKERWIL